MPLGGEVQRPTRAPALTTAMSEAYNGAYGGSNADCDALDERSAGDPEGGSRSPRVGSRYAARDSGIRIRPRHPAPRPPRDVDRRRCARLPALVGATEDPGGDGSGNRDWGPPVGA